MGLDVPVNTFAEYYYTPWWQKSEQSNLQAPAAPKMHFDGYGRINDGTAKPQDFHGKVVVVDTTGAGDVLTIQEGIDRARSGDTVFVRPGTYKERVRLKEGIRLWGGIPIKPSSTARTRDPRSSRPTGATSPVLPSPERDSIMQRPVPCRGSCSRLRFHFGDPGNIFFSNSVFGVLVESSRSDGYNTSSADRFIAPENALENIEYRGYSNPFIIGNTFYNIGERAIYCIHSAPEIANNIFMGNLKTLE